MSEKGEHLHLDDHPQTLSLLGELLGHRGDRDELGYSSTEYGAWVDWDGLLAGPLSSTEKATIYIARGCAILERHGGPPRRIVGILREVVRAVTE